MRYIKIRAKDINTGKFRTALIKPTDELDGLYLDGLQQDIDINTVDESSGLYDEEQNEIFENDIIEMDGQIGTVTYEKGRFIANFYFKMRNVAKKQITCKKATNPLYVVAPHCKVIGNLHDIPTKQCINKLNEKYQ